jgi:hypothetical protein
MSSSKVVFVPESCLTRKGTGEAETMELPKFAKKVTVSRRTKSRFM